MIIFSGKTTKAHVALAFAINLVGFGFTLFLLRAFVDQALLLTNGAYVGCWGYGLCLDSYILYAVTIYLALSFLILKVFLGNKNAIITLLFFQVVNVVLYYVFVPKFLSGLNEALYKTYL